MTDISKITTPWPAELMENYAWIDEYLLKQAGTKKEFQPAWQAYKYLLRGKMYAYMGIHDPSGRPILTLKLDPSYSDIMRQSFADIIPGYYMNKIHWSSVYLDGEVPQEILLDIVRASHGTMLLTFSKKAQKEILDGPCPS